MFAFCGIIKQQCPASQGWRQSPMKGGGAVTVYQSITLMIAFASLVVTIIALAQKK